MTKTEAFPIKDFSLFLAITSIVVVGHYLINPEDPSMRLINPNPILLVSVAFSAYRGIKFALVCSLFSAILYFGLFLTQVDFKAVEDIFSLKFIMLPISIVVISTLIGDSRQRALDKITTLKQKVDEKKAYFNKIQDKHEVLGKENYNLKKKIVTKLDTFKELHKTAQHLSTLDVDKLTNNLIKVINSRVEVKRSCFYSFDKGSNSFEFVAPCDLDKSEVERYNPASDRIIKKSIDQKRLITLREVLFEDAGDDNIKEALISVPVYYNGELYGVYVVFEMTFLDFVPQNINIIKELVSWYEESLKTAMDYEILTTSGDADFRYKAYKYKYFRQRLTEDLALSQKYSVPLHVVKLSLTNFDLASNFKRKMLKKFVIEYLRKNLGLSDSVCLGEKESDVLVIFLDTKENILEKTRDINKGLEQFNLLVDDKEKLQIAYFISSQKNTYKHVVDVLKSFEKVS